ncbi:hypothetical protein CRUP_019726 [Coryphaenoides rupestris]|nr:hypothetical protein CRUP_019726 [Coryphaenoides rupestris]
MTQYKAVAGPDCGQAFCRLGCVCSSLARINRGPLHCRRPDCMLGCDCFKRKITKQLLEGGCGEDEVNQPVQTQSHSLYAVTSLQHAIQPSPGAHWDRIWHKSKASPDPEPIHAPEGTERIASPGAIGRLAPTLSLHTQPAKPNAPAKKFPSIILTFENTGKTTMDKDSLDSTQIEVLSECHWDNDRKLILGALCQHMKRGSLATPFCAGPYHIALPTPASEEEEEEEEEDDDAEDSSDEEDIDENDSDDGEIRSLSEEEEEEAVKQHPGTEHPCSPGTDVQIGVTPFQSRVLPAGILQAWKKPSGSDVLGLVQVNGRSYPRACLMLGRVGSLHPANRLAAYVTGRLPQKAPVPGPQGNAQPTQGVKTASTLKNKEAIVIFLTSPIRTLKSFTAGWRGTAAASPCSTSYSSPVSITVSRALKEPSFLAERGTFSFRICPPVTNQQGGASTTTAVATAAAGHAQNLAGVTLPGGFTLIQLPKHGAKEALALPRRTPPPPPPLCDPDRPPEDETSEEGSSDSDQDDEDGDEDASTVEEESVDIETVEDLTKTIEQLRANSRSLCDSGDESGSSMESKSKQARPPRAQEGVKDEVKMEVDENEDAVDMMSGCRRRQHKVLERLRRSEQRYLFTRLQTILRTDPKAPKLRLLSQAHIEIQTLVENSKSLELQKKRLSDMQMLYIRRISCLAGKSEEVIRRKLKEVYERKQLPQAQRKSPFSLYKVPQVNVGGKATPLRPPQAPPESPAPPAPESPTPSLSPAQNQQPEPHPKPPAEPIASPQSTSLVAESQDIGSSSLPRPRRAAPPRVSPKRRVKSEDCSPEITTNARSPETKPQVKILTTGAAAEPPQPPPQPPPAVAAAAGSQPMTLPLIHKETAISPADQASKPAAGQSSEDGVPGGEEESDPSAPVAADDAGESSSPSPTSPEPLQQPKLSPLVEIARLNKSIVSLPSGKPLLLRSTAAAGENNGTSRLSFSPCSLVYVPLVQEPAKAERVQGQEGEAEPSPTAPRRGPGRPRKSPAVTPAGQNADDAGLSEGSTTEAPRPPPAAKAAAAKAAGAGAGRGGRGGSSKKAAVAASPVPVKRGPGRPRKRPLEVDNRGRGPKVKQAACTPVSQGRHRPVRNARKSPEEARPTRAICSPVVNQSGGEGSAKRPLTRGSLGKDFPSAKRMSWLDMEKELELD